jgi:hypothetical protein
MEIWISIFQIDQAIFERVIVLFHLIKKVCTIRELQVSFFERLKE